jgi:catechol 2,3-dioxygenase-like lactoylglutathione lyase family enzyme
MEIRRAIPVLRAKGPDEIRRFYEVVLGFRVAMDEDGMLMFTSVSVPTTQVIVAWPSPTADDPELMDVDISIEVADVDQAYLDVQADGYQIVRELRNEAWGIRRFFARDPMGNTVNIAGHR